MPEAMGSVKKGNVEEVQSSESVKPIENTEPENGVSSTSPEKKSPEKSEADILLAQGKRHLFVKDYPNAVASLGEACAKLSEMYGDLADSCADAYFSYGRALLELAREESNVLGTEPEKDSSEDGEEEEEETDNKPIEDGEAEAKSQEDDNKEDDKNKKVEEKEFTADETIDTTKEVEECETPAGEDKDEDVDNLQLAWEVLELAKTIFERQKSHAKLAETYLYLGEIGLESENYTGAIEDMKKCVEIQKEILPSDHRDIAETYFQLGVACSLCNEFEEAIVNFKMSSEILENRIDNLKKNGPYKADTEKNPFYSVEKEISEMKALLPEIKAKIADMDDFKQETIKSVMATLKEKPQSSDGAGPSSSAFTSTTPVTNGNVAKPASDISHLVRKKRKPEDDVSNESIKKSCSNETKK